MNDQELQEFRMKMEEIIAKSGHLIQGVADGPDSFAYTIGRTDKGLREFYMDVGMGPYHRLLNTVTQEFDKGYVRIGVPFTHAGWETKAEGIPTLFVVDFATDQQCARMIGAYRRAQRLGQEILPPLQIIVADEFNRLPPKYQPVN